MLPGIGGEGRPGIGGGGVTWDRGRGCYMGYGLLPGVGEEGITWDRESYLG